MGCIHREVGCICGKVGMCVCGCGSICGDVKIYVWEGRVYVWGGEDMCVGR